MLMNVRSAGITLRAEGSVASSPTSHPTGLSLGQAGVGWLSKLSVALCAAHVQLGLGCSRLEHRYVLFASPLYSGLRHWESLEQARVEVWSVAI